MHEFKIALCFSGFMRNYKDLLKNRYFRIFWEIMQWISIFPRGTSSDMALTEIRNLIVTRKVNMQELGSVLANV